MWILAGCQIYMVSHLTITLIGSYPCFRCINWQVQIVWPNAITLRIAVGESTSLQHLIIAEIKTIYQYAGTKGCLLYFGKIVFRVLVQCHFTNRQEWELISWPNLGIIQRIKI